MSAQEGRLHFLDGARAIAVALVLLGHINESFFVLFPDADLQKTIAFMLLWNLDLGKIGVTLFFIISGYLIPFAVDTENKNYLKLYFTRRLLRIYPLFILSIPLGLYLEQHLSGKDVSWLDFPLNLLLIPNFFERPFAMGLYWTLQIELCFYLAVGILLLDKNFFRSSWGIPAMFIVLTLAAELLRAINRETSTFALAELAKIAGMLAFMLFGSFLRKISDRSESMPERWIFGIFFTYLCVYLPLKLALSSVPSEAPLLSSLSQVIAIITFCLLKKFPSATTWIRPIGTISYSVYLVHGIVIHYFLVFGFRLGASIFDASSVLHYFMYAITISILTLALSTFTFRTIEKPFMNIGRS